MPKENRPATLDHLAKRKPMEREVPVVLEDEPGEELAVAEVALREAQKSYDDWLAERRDLQIMALRTLPEQRREEFVRSLPDPDGAEGRLADLSAAKEAVEGAKALRDVTVYVRFRAMGRKAYEALVEAHPPTEAENADWLEKNGTPAPYSAETFPPALIAASAVRPEMSPEYVTQIWDEWNSADLTELFSAALMVDTYRRRSLGNA